MRMRENKYIGPHLNAIECFAVVLVSTTDLIGWRKCVYDGRKCTCTVTLERSNAAGAIRRELRILVGDHKYYGHPLK